MTTYTEVQEWMEQNPEEAEELVRRREAKRCKALESLKPGQKIFG